MALFASMWGYSAICLLVWRTESAATLLVTAGAAVLILSGLALLIGS